MTNQPGRQVIRGGLGEVISVRRINDNIHQSSFSNAVAINNAMSYQRHIV